VKHVKNIYRTLLSRGMKGYYVYFTDKETEEFFRARMEKQTVINLDGEVNIIKPLNNYYLQPLIFKEGSSAVPQEAFILVWLSWNPFKISSFFCGSSNRIPK
jgi:hypothetical protein